MTATRAEPSPGDARQAARAFRNECEGWVALGVAAPADGVFAVERVGGLVGAWWRDEGGWGENCLLSEASDPAELGEQLRAVDDRARASESRTTLRLLPGGEVEPWEAAAREQGYVLRSDSPLMAADLGAELPAVELTPEASLAPAEDEAAHTAAIRLAREVYRDPAALTEFFGPRGVVRPYLARWEGEPAACATLWPFAGVAGVFSVATLPRFRRRGLATALIATILQDARAEGYDLACLRTLHDLVPLYERLGFREVGHPLLFRRVGW